MSRKARKARKENKKDLFSLRFLCGFFAPFARDPFFPTFSWKGLGCVKYVNALFWGGIVTLGPSTRVCLQRDLGRIHRYQFNVVVPNIPASDAAPLTFSMGGRSGTQTLFVPVQN